jgi:hypothetical protein
LGARDILSRGRTDPTEEHERKAEREDPRRETAATTRFCHGRALQEMNRRGGIETGLVF